MVVIRNSLANDCFLFPPTNHEGLHISQQTPQSTSPPSSSFASPSQRSSSSSSSSSFSSSPSSSSQLDQIEDDPEPFSELDETGDDDDDPESLSPPDSRIRLPSDVSVWLRTGLEVLRSKVLGIVSGFRNYAAVRRGPVWWLGSAAGVVMALLVSLSYKSIRRRRFREQRINKLMILLKERDEVRVDDFLSSVCRNAYVD